MRLFNCKSKCSMTEQVSPSVVQRESKGSGDCQSLQLVPSPVRAVFLKFQDLQREKSGGCMELRAVCEAHYTVANVLQADAFDPYVAKQFTLESASRAAQLCTEDLMRRVECSQRGY